MDAGFESGLGFPKRPTTRSVVVRTVRSVFAVVGLGFTPLGSFAMAGKFSERSRSDAKSFGYKR